MPKPDLLLGESCRSAMLRVFETLGHLVGLTLGPTTGTIANERDGTGEIETIRDAATAVRRVIQIAAPREDAGAMLMRHLVWEARHDAGDGSATAAVIACSLARDGFRVITAGANPMMILRGIRKGLRAALLALDAQAIPLESDEEIAKVATAACGDREIGRLIGEIFDVLGPHAQVVIVPYVATFHDRKYREGARFEGHYVSPYLLTDQAQQCAVLYDARVLAADIVIDTAEEAAFLLDQVARLGGKSLFLICKRASDRSVGVFASNNERGSILSTMATLTQTGEARRGAIENIAVLTGGVALNGQPGLSVDHVTAGDYGQVDQVVLDREQFTIVGGHGRSDQIDARREALRTRLQSTDEAEERDVLRELLAQLSRGVAELRIGALTDTERSERIETSRQAIKAVEAGLESGIVPGGGAAYLGCIPAVEAIATQGDEAIGTALLARSLEEPMRRIAANAGYHPPLAISRAMQQGAGYGLDAVSKRIVSMLEAGIADPAVVARRALEHGVSGALMLLSTEALVIHRKPKESVNP